MSARMAIQPVVINMPTLWLTKVTLYTYCIQCKTDEMLAYQYANAYEAGKPPTDTNWNEAVTVQ